MLNKMISSLPSQETMDYEAFLRHNRNRVNYSLSRILWFCILAGPAIALGIMGGVFKRTSYMACVMISAVMLVMAAGNDLVRKRQPYSYVPGILALAGMELLLCYMNASHISIRLTWFLIPLLSLLFCDTRVYIGISILNYLMMALSIWLEAPHYAEIRTDFTTPLLGFINIFSGCTIETILMFAAGFTLGKATENYYRQMIGKYAETLEQERQMKEQLEILDSMAEIYDFVNLIDFKESTEMSLREETLHKIHIESGQTHTHMTQVLRNQIASDMLEDFWAFNDITTVPLRLVNHRIIAGEFVSTASGWFRAQYIRVRGEMHQQPEAVIFTIQNIDSDKRREEQLIRISMTDELTRLFNRRSYEEDTARLKQDGMEKDLAMISADVNGLKRVNDTLGHSAGDELIKGAAYCLLSAIGSRGKVYRTGGDEFMAIVRTEDCQSLIKEIRERSDGWQGTMADHVSMAIGYAAHADYPSASVADLEILADQNMYEDKARYYEETGRRA